MIFERLSSACLSHNAMNVNLIGKLISNTCQYSMILYAANPDTIVSPTVVISLGSVWYFLCVLDLMFEFCAERERRLE
jgi:hypothetical protein